MGSVVFIPTRRDYVSAMRAVYLASLHFAAKVLGPDQLAELRGYLERGRLPGRGELL